jgi:hypothetical protein
MKNLAKGRFAAVMLASILVAVLPEWNAEFRAPLPANAGLEEVWRRLEAGAVRSINTAIPALVSALVGFFVRADRSMPLLSVADVKEQR